MATGTVKWFNDAASFGFITPGAGGGEDLFAHFLEIQAAGFKLLKGPEGGSSRSSRAQGQAGDGDQADLGLCPSVKKTAASAAVFGFGVTGSCCGLGIRLCT